MGARHTITVIAVSLTLILAFGGWLAIHGRISLGTFLAFSSYMVQLVAPVRMFAVLMAVGQQARAGAERIFMPYVALHLLAEYFDKYPDAAEKVVLSIKGGFVPGTHQPDGSAEVSRYLSFREEQGQKDILKYVDHEARGRETISQQETNVIVRI